MNKKEIQERLWQLWQLWPQRHWEESQESLDVHIWQDCPNTATQVVYQTNHRHYDSLGFAKVQYPDVWDAGYGIDLAVKKALASIARQIVEDENGK